MARVGLAVHKVVVVVDGFVHLPRHRVQTEPHRVVAEARNGAQRPEGDQRAENDSGAKGAAKKARRTHRLDHITRAGAPIARVAAARDQAAPLGRVCARVGEKMKKVEPTITNFARSEALT